MRFLKLNLLIADIRVGENINLGHSTNDSLSSENRKKYYQFFDKIISNPPFGMSLKQTFDLLPIDDYDDDKDNDFHKYWEPLKKAKQL